MIPENIIKAMEYCVGQGITSECEGCKYKKGCRPELIVDALALIKRLKAKNKEFDEKIVIQMGTIDWQAKEINRQKAEKTELQHKISELEAEVEKLNVELVGMRGACESYKIHYDNAKAEIERLNAVSEICGDCHKQYAEKIARAKSEAVKEFAERLKENANRGFWEEDAYVSTLEIYNLIKEMTEI